MIFQNCCSKMLKFWTYVQQMNHLHWLIKAMLKLGIMSQLLPVILHWNVVFDGYLGLIQCLLYLNSYSIWGVLGELSLFFWGGTWKFESPLLAYKSTLFVLELKIARMVTVSTCPLAPPSGQNVLVQGGMLGRQPIFNLTPNSYLFIGRVVVNCIVMNKVCIVGFKKKNKPQWLY